MEEENPAEIGISEFGASTAKGSLIFTSSKVLSAIVTLALLIFLARVLKPADYGLYAIVVAFSTTLHASGNFGMATAMRKKLPQLKSLHDKFLTLSSAYAMSLAVTALVVIAGVAISGLLAVYAYNDSALQFPLEIGAVMVLFSVMFNLSISALIGIGKVAGSSISVIVYSAVQLIAVVIFVLMGFGIVGALLGTVLGLLAGFIVAIAYTLKYIGFEFVKPTKAEMGELGKFTLPLVVSGISVNGSKSIAVLVLGIFASSFIVGEYNAAFRLGSFAEVIITSLAFMLLPAFSKAFVNEGLAKRLSSIFNSSIYYTLLFMLPIIAYVASTAKPLIYLFFSSAYSFTPPYFIAIVIGITIGIIGNYGSNIIIGYGDTKRTTKYQLTVVAVELLLLVALTPFIKVYGVLVSVFIVGPLVMDAIYISALKKSFNISLDYRQLALLVAASIVLLAVLYIPSVLIHGKKLLLVDAVLAFLAYPIIAGELHAVRKKNLE
ncbi:MAG: oligosaccharide flippase family protein, partial [Candidatus Micrarchaeaceae archaeon]